MRVFRSLKGWGAMVAGLVVLALGVGGARLRGPLGSSAQRAPAVPLPLAVRTPPKALGEKGPPPGGIARDGPPPLLGSALLISASGTPPDRASGESVEEPLLDLRVALMLHDRELGERVYGILRNRRHIAVERARAYLREAKDPLEYEATERAISLLSAPPTHGLLRHFPW